MLYPSQHNPFLHTPPTTFSLPVSPQKMEASKLETETAAFGEHFGGSNGDDLFVDELLDFSNGFSEVEEPEETQPEKKTPTTFSNSVSQDTKPVVVLSEEANAITGQKDAFGPLPDSQITLPAEDLENLEWLSHFVEDSFSDFSLTGKLPPKPVEPAAQQPCFVTPVQTKARTKRARTGVRVCPVLSPESSTSSGSSTSLFPQSTLWVGSEPLFGKPVMKKRKKAAEGGGNTVAQPRRCSHCGVTKTPQWRAGPLGSKTLCNACGVRFKSGRLLPEYRPACSPTFSSELHSNNHRKVLEMRRKKETGLDGGEPVPSF